VMMDAVSANQAKVAGMPNSADPQQYCLRWKYHHNNLQVMFSQLLERESFCDVTLASEGKLLRAHKVCLNF
jgi:BTB/POZ domain